MTKLDEKSISILMHELRSPINTLLGLVGHTKLKLDSMTEMEKMLSQIEDIASYLLSLTNNYLEISKNENAYNSDKKEDIFNLKELLSYVINVYNFQFKLKNIDFYSNVEDTNVALVGDSIKLKQILINILSNSFKYTPSFGKVWLDCGYKLNNAEEIELKIILKDTGIGMGKDFLEEIFTPYKRECNELIPKGTGLGLCIVRNNLIDLNGAINIESIRGKGTIIKITIPIKISKVKYDFSNSCILIIEDCEITQKVIISQLSGTGAKFDVASDGETGLNMFISSPINHYQFILLDNKLTKLDGAIVAKRIRRQPRIDANKVKIIGISASSFDCDIKRCIAAGMNEYIVKPCSKDKLLHTISKLLTISR